jgi:voltage-dependent calcium channel alpha-2/delta-3
VIILIDASGSMTGLKKSIAIQTVETILDTLSDDDFVQIIKVNSKLNFFHSRKKSFF